MPYIFLLIFTLLFTGCNPATISNQPAVTTIEDKPSENKPSMTTIENEPSVKAMPLPVSHQDTDINDLKILDEDSIVGNYLLKRGMFRNQEISEGYLTIEEIDVNNYGYYYVTIAGKLTPETHTGIFFKKGGKFVQKVIEDSSEAEVRQGKNKSKMSIIDNINLIQKGELLRLNINSTKKEKLIWKRDINEIEKSEQMKKALKNARYEYLKYYQEKCTDSAEFCGDFAYTPVNE